MIQESPTPIIYNIVTSWINELLGELAFQMTIYKQEREILNFTSWRG